MAPRKTSVTPSIHVKKNLAVTIPEEHFRIFEFKQDEMQGVALVNSSLKDFDPKKVFSWHCSIWIELEDVISTFLPTNAEDSVLKESQALLDKSIKESINNHVNALFLAAIKWNHSFELMWRIYQPQSVNDFLLNLIHTDYLRQFDFRIDPDREWRLAKWVLTN